MGILDYFRSSSKASASVAKERLQIVIAHERAQRGGPEYLPRLHAEILEVIRKYVPIDDDRVKMNLEREGDYEVLELNIALPETEKTSV